MKNKKYINLKVVATSDDVDKELIHIKLIKINSKLSEIFNNTFNTIKSSYTFTKNSDLDILLEELKLLDKRWLPNKLLNIGA